MEWILLANGITPYIYALAVYLTPEEMQEHMYPIYVEIFLVQLLITIILSLCSKDAQKLAKVTMINKLIQIPYYIMFLIFPVCIFLIGMGLMGIGIIFLPFLLAIDYGVFLSTMIPEQICTIKLRLRGSITTGKFLLFLIGNAMYVVDVILSVLIYKTYKQTETQQIQANVSPQVSGLGDTQV